MPLDRRAAGSALCVLALVLASAVHAQGIQEWKTPDGKLFFGDRPPPGSTLVGATQSLGTSGGGEVSESAPSARTVDPEAPPSEAPQPQTPGSDEPVNAGVSLAKRNRLYFDTWSQRGLSTTELEVVERNLNAVRNDVGRDLRVDHDARFQVVLTEPAVFHRYSGTREQVSGLFDGKINIPIPAGINESELQGTLWHEYTHAVIFSKAGNQCPHWFERGDRHAPAGEDRSHAPPEPRDAGRTGWQAPVYVAGARSDVQLADGVARGSGSCLPSGARGGRLSLRALQQPTGERLDRSARQLAATSKRRFARRCARRSTISDGTWPIT